ncbi:MAG: CoA ester lyase [Caldilineae bacterium]|nr:MAG: CoA ester lyase [Caldilineae bacterium]
MRPRRAMLFMPGDSERKIAKACTLQVDSIIMDLEDGVAWSQKQNARETVRRALQTFDFGERERVVRINPEGSGLEEDDLEAVLPGQPDAIALPKVETPAQLIWLDDALTRWETRQEAEVGSIAILAIVETALGIVNLREIAQASRRLQALLFGAEDLVGDIGGVRTAEGREVFYARSKLVTTAAAFRLQAIDQVFTDLHDLEGLERECRQAVQMGYQGKMAIHPRQVPVIQAAFSPTPAQIEAARRLIDAYRQYQARGSGVFTLDGKMVDAPMIRAAEQILARARQQNVPHPEHENGDGRE